VGAIEVICPYCEAPAELVDSEEIYGQSYGMSWLCRPCWAYVGTHKNSKYHAPFGTLANKKLRELRKEAHRVFDPVWENTSMSRRGAYNWLARTLEIPIKRAHIGQFNVAECQQVIEVCNVNTTEIFKRISKSVEETNG